MQLGIDHFLERYVNIYEKKRIGLITNTTGVNENLIPTIDLLYDHPQLNLVALFAPEHGIRGDVKEGAEISFFIDEKTNLPVYSLYGETKKPNASMLESIDIMFFDLQDIGSRYYTYIYTLALVMEACAENGIECLVLDRPNPISGENMEGNLVEEDVRSFVGMLPLPNRHGLTVGELAHIFKNEFNYNCELTVIPMVGWERDMYYEETGLLWIPPSPNTTTIDMCILYTGTCLFEGTNVSEGRGTTQPFERIGAPYIDGHILTEHFNKLNLPGVLARPVTFIPYYQKYVGKLCSGIQLHIVNRNTIKPLKVGMELIKLIISLYPNDFEFIQSENNKYFFDLLSGTKKLRRMLLDNNINTYYEQNEQHLVYFEQKVEGYRMYK